MPGAPTPPEELKGVALEQAARDELRRALGLSVNISAPTWRQVMFMGQPIAFKLPDVPPGVAARISSVKPDVFAKDAVGLAALQLAEKLQGSKPGRSFRRSVVPGMPLPNAHGSLDDWERLVFLVGAGPACLQLLVASGNLTSGDVEIMTTAYPEEMEHEKFAAIQAATAFTHAGARAGVDPEIPDWLNDQMLTLMDEERPVEVFQAIYAKQPEKTQPGPSPSGRSKIAEQYRPNPGLGDNS
jgi:hypothetical protein